MFYPGERRKYISVQILEDSKPEGNETFSVQLFDVSGEWVYGKFGRGKYSSGKYGNGKYSRGKYGSSK